ncbi:hypothetical protein PHYBOEH_008704 [Phytophthora boehmeriae]|uniref:Uncharacterized protein n=1 Tax=Phytophthora boehmeriae TaxID=109152 RepID=A0A8T1W2D7_9STRA|nr:hypothetical protein PHYBOEH_008704 [Phytophthora boehmeriae]
MSKFSVFGILLLCVAALAVAQDTHNTQDTHNAGGQAGSVVDDAGAPTTAPPSNNNPPPNNKPPAAPAVPAPPAAPPSAPQTTAMAPWTQPGGAPAAVPAPMVSGSMSSGSGSFDDIESPGTKKPKKITASPTPTPSEDSGVPVLSMTCAWTIVVLAGLAGML